MIVPFDSAPSPVIEPATNDVPSGISSVTVTVPAAFPLFVNVIVYVNVSPTFASGVFTSFLPVIFATGVITGGVSFSPTTAAFVTSFTTSPAAVSLFIITSKLTVVFPFALTATSLHVIVLPSNFPSSDIVPSTISVPSGIVSVTVVLPGTLELFVIVITYLSVSPTFALVASASSPSTTRYASFAVVTTGVSVVGVSSPLTLAVLLINVISFSLITFTLKDNSTVSPAAITFFQVIFPFTNSPPSEIVSSTSSVPSGIASIVRIVDVGKLPVFLILITYVISCPGCTTVLVGSAVIAWFPTYAVFVTSKFGVFIFKPAVSVLACRLIGVHVISSVFQGFSTTVVCVYSVSGTVVPAFPVVVPVVVPWLVVVPGFVVVSPFWAGVVGFWLSSIIGICSGLSVFGVFGFSTPPLLFESFPLLAGSVTSVFSIAAAALLLPLI